MGMPSRDTHGIVTWSKWPPDYTMVGWQAGMHDVTPAPHARDWLHENDRNHRPVRPATRKTEEETGSMGGGENPT